MVKNPPCNTGDLGSIPGQGTEIPRGGGLVAKLCPPLVDMVFSLPGFSVHGISQATILEWVAISFSRGSFQPRDQTQVSCIAGGFFTSEPTGKPSQGS